MDAYLTVAGGMILLIVLWAVLRGADRYIPSRMYFFLILIVTMLPSMPIWKMRKMQKRQDSSPGDPVLQTNAWRPSAQTRIGKVLHYVLSNYYSYCAVIVTVAVCALIYNWRYIINEIPPNGQLRDGLWYIIPILVLSLERAVDRIAAATRHLKAVERETKNSPHP
jgi:hypothetical protein